MKVCITQHSCCIGMTVPQFMKLMKIDYLDIVAPRLEIAGAIPGTVDYDGHFGPNVFFRVDAGTDTAPILQALKDLIGK